MDSKATPGQTIKAKLGQIPLRQSRAEKIVLPMGEAPAMGGPHMHVAEAVTRVRRRRWALHCRGERVQGFLLQGADFRELLLLGCLLLQGIACYCRG